MVILNRVKSCKTEASIETRLFRVAVPHGEQSDPQHTKPTMCAASNPR